MPVDTNRQRQRFDNAVMTLAILFSLKTVELLQIGFATHFQAIPLFSVGTESQVSLQHCHSVDADAWYKRALNADEGIWHESRGQCHSMPVSLLADLFAP